MRIFEVKAFARFAKKARIPDAALRTAVDLASRGMIDADLGAGVIKQRIARKGAGKSGGFRTIIVFRLGSRAIFVHGFAKNDQGNISDRELATFKLLAAEMLNYDDGTIAKVTLSGEFIEVSKDDDKK